MIKPQKLKLVIHKVKIVIPDYKILMTQNPHHVSKNSKLKM